MLPPDYLALLADLAPVCAMFAPGELRTVRLDTDPSGVLIHPLDVLPAEHLPDVQAVVVITTGKGTSLDTGEEFRVKIGVCMTPLGSHSVLERDGTTTVLDAEPEGDIADRMRLIVRGAA